LSDIAFDATIRAAAPFQNQRKDEAQMWRFMSILAIS
jgi:hypothetical protein